ncbi:hypothetical protein E2562_018380 [Oryza meyeriana var. granulata]|uniref:Reverse transcriptase zinc-binding domain-containing protein n=1 Tax=Oryza meyeriana var. granulata TaxID=110450 RepID=A0A6G1D728_9ORYZ|nr:hypothetical protein E2562_018380 [Oryza meyeriana var. granulata]
MQATGLATNIQKSHVAAIRCGNIDLEDTLEEVSAVWSYFPIKYIGLPLVLGRMRKVDIQRVFDKIVRRIASWRGKNMGPTGRTTLVKSVLTAQPIYLLTVLKITKEALEQIDKQWRRFFWVGTGTVTGGKCKINWTRTCMPTAQGDLGVLNIEKFARAPCLRWLWHEWKDPRKPWPELQTLCDETNKLPFAAVTKITIGDGNTARFWESAWLQGQRPKDLMPLVYAISKKRHKTLQQGLQNDAWIHDLDLLPNPSITVNLISQLVALWSETRRIQLDQNEPDQITWQLTNYGEYSASSAYKA